MELKRGVLYKRGAGGFLKRKNWKRRYFVLRDDEIRYFDTHNGCQKGTIKLQGCSKSVEIQPADCHKTGNSASTEWRIAINTPTRRFFISTATEFEMYEWAEALQYAIELANDAQACRSTLSTSADECFQEG
ncbi:unnamed protein product [Aphanomyces euteiches]|uniref:PH domain-containing protein n=1 Tax=Aphanomyces euteiches TaxID=100861 RepID=A0A6G0WH21_9STRA|nr:hypothetical protein Ae201684_015275 [Aphanomyces euteiches]KAH9072013.1 hypothetical protein Ae201684P_021150 [Aphanomyces euteiches]KAH9143719.1 hypothetical protein AeRB84_012299 [Aphanomyces euteiches]